MPSQTQQKPWWLGWHLAWLEIRGDLRFALSFTLSIAVGLIGFLTIDAFQRSLTEHLTASSQAMLGADLAITSPRPLTSEEAAQVNAILPVGTKTRNETSLMSMAASSAAARLVEIRAIDADFPYYGALSLRQQGTINQSSTKDITQDKTAWIYPELLVQLNLKIGEQIKIGQTTLTVSDVIDDDPALSGLGFQIAPKIYIGQATLADTQLLQKGSRIFYSLYAKLSEHERSNTDAIVNQLKAALPAKEIRIRSHRGASEDLSRVLSYLNDYLGLVALVALFLAAVGAAYLFRGFIERRAKEIAILTSIGAGQQLILMIYTLQLSILGGAAAILTLVVAQLVLPTLPQLLAGLLPENVKIAIHPISAGIAAALSIGGSLLFCLPTLMRLNSIKPTSLFQEAANPRLNWTAKQFLAWLPAFCIYWLLACLQSNSWRIGSLFVAIFLGAGALFAVLVLGGLRIVERRLGRIAKTPAVGPWLAAMSLVRRRAATLASFLAIALGSLLMALIPQIRAVLTLELEQTPGQTRPSLFLFDIQDEQVEPLAASLASIGTKWQRLAPMVRAQLEQINGQMIERQEESGTREAEQSARLQNRGYNLSYADAQSPPPLLVAGRPFSGRYDTQSTKPAEISLEQRFAERLNLKIGDRLLFDVQGVKIEGEVINLRRVRWTSFEPNFFVEFQAGVLEDAPKIWLATLPDMQQSQKTTTQMRIVSDFPNISVIDVAQSIGRVLGIVQQMSWAILFMAALSLFAGLTVLFAIARHEADKRARDIALLKSLGATFGQIRATIAWEFASLGLAAATAGSSFSIIVAFILTQVLFDRLFVLTIWIPLSVLIAVAALCLFTGMAATARSLRMKPQLLLGR